MAIMESKRAGTCNDCRGPIEVGDLIDWDRGTGARHNKKANPQCQPKVATEAERKGYEKVVLAELKAWDGKGSYRPTAFGDYIHAQG